MKRTFVTFLLILSFLTPQVSTATVLDTTQKCTFTRLLVQGAEGADVTCLQTFLRSQGHLQGAPTGFYGPATEAAVAAWQRAQGIIAGAYEYGNFGEQSRVVYEKNVLGVTTATPTAPASTATTLDNTVLIQKLLAQIVLLQAELNKLTAGQKTTQKCTFTRLLVKGTQGTDVTCLQTFLRSRGHYQGASTGFYGPVTEAAVAAWQRAEGIIAEAYEYGHFGEQSRQLYTKNILAMKPTAPAISTPTSTATSSTGGGSRTVANTQTQTVTRRSGGGGGGSGSSGSTAEVASVDPAVRFAVDMDDMELIGPFDSWANVKTDYGAVGDGITDDTAAIQAALDAIGRPSNPGILYIPSGTYKITSSLVMENITTGGPRGHGLVGEDPANTIIKWYGPAGDPMLRENGGNNTVYSRITWDGSGTAGYGIAHWWNKTTNPHNYAGSMEHTDEVFKDMNIGIMAGRHGASYDTLVSEGQIRRVTFINNTYAGFDTGGWNALDWWIWDSHFVDCGRGLSNTYGLNDSDTVVSGAGAFYVYRSLFEGSTVADVNIANTGWFSMYENVSVGSRRFFQGETIGRNAASIIIKGNRIVDTTDPAAVSVGSLGLLALIDNEIRSESGATDPVVVMNGLQTTVYGWNVLSVGNQYTVEDPLPAENVTTKYNRVTSIDDSVVARSAISSSLLTLPDTPEWANRVVYEVPSGANTATIQALIDEAANSGNTNPVVHFPAGTYTLSTTLTVPAQKRIQLAGDGRGTVLNLSGAGTPIFSLTGPSYATVRDMLLQGGGAAGAKSIAITNANQTGGRILIEGSRPGALTASNLSRTALAMQANTGFPSLTLSGVKSAVSVGAGGIGPVTMSGDSELLMADTWYEGSDTRLFRISSGDFTYIGGVLAPASHDGYTSEDLEDPTILFDNYSDQATFLGVSMNLSTIPSGIGIQVDNETSATKALFAGIQASYYSATEVQGTLFNRTSSGGTVGLLYPGEYNTTDGSTQSPNQGDVSSDHIINSLAQLRGLDWDTEPYDAPSGATDVRIYRLAAPDTAGMTITDSLAFLPGGSSYTSGSNIVTLQSLLVKLKFLQAELLKLKK